MPVLSGVLRLTAHESAFDEATGYRIKAMMV